MASDWRVTDGKVWGGRFWSVSPSGSYQHHCCVDCVGSRERTVIRRDGHDDSEEGYGASL